MGRKYELIAAMSAVAAPVTVFTAALATSTVPVCLSGRGRDKTLVMRPRATMVAVLKNCMLKDACLKCGL